jgi:hypothetical protein
MKSNTSSNFLGFLVVICFCLSCSSDLDFKQTKDLKLAPAIVTNFVNFDAKATVFVKNGIELTPISETQSSAGFNDIFLKKNLVQADLYFEITNTIARDYKVNLVFYDVNNQPIHTINIDVPAYNGTSNLVTKTETFDSATVAVLRSTVSINYEIVMLPGTVLTENSLGSLKFRSSLTAKFEIK